MSDKIELQSESQSTFKLWYISWHMFDGHHIPIQLAYWPTDIFIRLPIEIKTIVFGTKTMLLLTLFVSLILENVSILTNELPNLVAPFLAPHAVAQLVQRLLSLKWQLLVLKQHLCLCHYFSSVMIQAQMQQKMSFQTPCHLIFFGTSSFP